MFDIFIIIVWYHWGFFNVRVIDVQVLEDGMVEFIIQSKIVNFGACQDSISLKINNKSTGI